MKARDTQTAEMFKSATPTMLEGYYSGEWGVTELYIPPDADVQTFRELARQVIREYLQAHPGTSKDRIYDELVSRMVRAGQMESHNFGEILREVADEVAEPRKKNLFENEDPAHQPS